VRTNGIIELEVRKECYAAIWNNSSYTRKIIVGIAGLIGHGAGNLSGFC